MILKKRYEIRTLKTETNSFVTARKFKQRHTRLKQTFSSIELCYFYLRTDNIFMHQMSTDVWCITLLKLLASNFDLQLLLEIKCLCFLCIFSSLHIEKEHLFFHSNNVVYKNMCSLSQSLLSTKRTRLNSRKIVICTWVRTWKNASQKCFECNLLASLILPTCRI